MKVHHLLNNWHKGRYTVSPILRGHREKVSGLDSNGKLFIIVFNV